MKGNQKGGIREFLMDIVMDFAACTIYALGTQVFNAPSNIAPGGVTGISILINYLFGLPIALLTLVINIPLLILAFCFLGKTFTIKTMKTVLIMTLMLTVVGQYVPVYEGERILAALFGGVLSGVGAAMVFMRSSTSGGTDIIARLIQKKRPDIAVGRLLLILDVVVLASAAMVYRNIESALFALVGIYARTQILDSILCGLDMGKVLLVVSDKHDEMAREINSHLGRGCTMLDAKGTYTMQSRPMLMCVVRKSQYYDLKKMVNALDPDAFIIAVEANEIIGKGFKHFAGT